MSTSIQQTPAAHHRDDVGRGGGAEALLTEVDPEGVGDIAQLGSADAGGDEPGRGPRVTGSGVPPREPVIT